MIQKKTGEHTIVTLRGMVQAESHQLIAEANTMAEIQIGLEGMSGYLFYGLVTGLDVQIQTAEGVQYQELYLEAMSHTCLLDQRKERLAFQQKSISYRELLNKVLSGYSGAEYLFSPQMPDKAVGQFLVQFEETDWEFLTRVASRERVPLVASNSKSGIRFTLGAVWGSQAYTIPSSEEDRVEVIQSDNYYLRWQIQDPKAPAFELGDAVSYRGNTCYVKEAEISIKDHVLQQTCLICGKEGFEVAGKENLWITGLSLAGSVKEVKGNQLKITLDIDAMEENLKRLVRAV